MKALLLQDIPGIGNRGEVKEVKRGFFKNFLLPKKLAKALSDGVLKNLAEEQKKIGLRAEKDIKTANELIKRMSELNIQLNLKEGMRGQVFGSISKQKLIDAVKEKGIEIKKEQIEMSEHIKTFGFHEIKINFGHAVSGILKIEVVPENVS